MPTPKYKKQISGKLLEIYKSETQSNVSLPFVDQGVKAGFPSPAQDYLDISIDLNKELIKDQSSTFLARVKGHSMQDNCIDDGDILVVDKSLEAKDGDTVICFIDEEFTLKTLKKEKGEIFLMPANPDFQPIKITQDNHFMIWGVVTYSIRNHKINHKHR